MSKKSKLPGIEEIESKIERLFEALDHEEDSICVIVATAFVDHYLGALLGKYLIEGTTTVSLLDSQGAIGNLFSKARIAYCLGLISKGCFQSIEVIAQIRNEFAHKLDVTKFDSNGKVVELCEKLKPPVGMTIEAPLVDGGEPVALVEFTLGKTYLPTNRGHFTLVANLICTYLTIKTLSISRCVRVEDKWDHADSLSKDDPLEKT